MAHLHRASRLAHRAPESDNSSVPFHSHSMSPRGAGANGGSKTSTSDRERQRKLGEKPVRDVNVSALARLRLAGWMKRGRGR